MNKKKANTYGVMSTISGGHINPHRLFIYIFQRHNFFVGGKGNDDAEKY